MSETHAKNCAQLLKDLAGPLWRLALVHDDPIGDEAFDAWFNLRILGLQIEERGYTRMNASERAVFSASAASAHALCHDLASPAGIAISVCECETAGLLRTFARLQAADEVARVVREVAQSRTAAVSA